MIRKWILIGWVCAIIATNLHAQRYLMGYMDAGANNVSGGFFLRSAALGAYEYEKYKVEGGGQFELKSHHSTINTGLSLRLGRTFTLREVPFDVFGLFMLNRFSKSVFEYNWGVLARIKRSHFQIALGTNFRTYALTADAIDLYDVDGNSSIHENWNVMYSVAYRLKPHGHPWNVGVTLTNFDHFLIGQETNPGMNLHGEVRCSKSVTSFVELWHRRSGMFNLSVNYFGFFVRGGVKWRFGGQ